MDHGLWIMVVIVWGLQPVMLKSLVSLATCDANMKSGAMKYQSKHTDTEVG